MSTRFFGHIDFFLTPVSFVSVTMLETVIKEVFRNVKVFLIKVYVVKIAEEII